MHITIVRTVIVSLVLAGLVLAVLAALTGVLIVLALMIGLAVLNIVYLPTAARRLHLAAGWLALMFGSTIFLSLSGVQVFTCSGNDSVAQSAMPNQNVLNSSKL